MANQLINKKKLVIVILLFLVTPIFLGTTTSYSEEVVEQTDVIIQVNGTLTYTKENEEQSTNIKKSVPTIIKDTSIKNLPHTGETYAKHLIFLGVTITVIFLSLYLMKWNEQMKQQSKSKKNT